MLVRDIKRGVERACGFAVGCALLASRDACWFLGVAFDLGFSFSVDFNWELLLELRCDLFARALDRGLVLDVGFATPLLRLPVVSSFSFEDRKPFRASSSRLEA